jgi:hypothetical protein
MSDYKAQFWRGLIRRTESGKPVFIHAKRDTAQFYGWVDAFDEHRPEVAIPPRPDGRHFVRPVAPDPWTGGRPMRICRSDSRSSTPRGLTNRFRIARQATNADLRLLAHATQGDWRWMTDKNGHRRTRPQWFGFV